MNISKFSNSWAWVPTLYFAEGLPYFLVNEISVLLFTKMGVPNGQMAAFTSLLYLPWVIKPFWSPFVDILKTKRWWIVATQCVISTLLLLITLTLPRPAHTQIMAGETPISLFTITLILFIITAFASATHDIAADGFYMLGQSEKQQSAFVGIRSTFYRFSNVFCNGLLVMFAGWLEMRESLDIPAAWQITLAVLAAFFTLISLYHHFLLPRPVADKQHQIAIENRSTTAVFREFGRTFATFFTKPKIALALVFLLIYRLPEALLIKMCKPFLLASHALGGLAMSTLDVGVIYGTIGVVALTVGGILGGLYAARFGLRHSLLPMALLLTLPCFVYVYFAYAMPSNYLIISVAVALEQFGYGFGFTAYMLYLMYFSEGEFKTSHYAFGTGFMALSMMLPGFFAGYLQESLGYLHFFWLVMICCLPTLLVTYFVRRKINAEYGKSKKS